MWHLYWHTSPLMHIGYFGLVYIYSILGAYLLLAHILQSMGNECCSVSIFDVCVQ